MGCNCNTTAGGGGGPLLDPATASELQHVIIWAIGICIVVYILAWLAFVIDYLLGGPAERLEEAGNYPGGRAPQQQPAAAVGAVSRQVAGEDDAVPMVIICKAAADGGDVRRDPTCGVCLAELSAGGALRALSPCRHCFHSACARELVRLHATCPLCQAPVAAAGSTVDV